MNHVLRDSVGRKIAEIRTESSRDVIYDAVGRKLGDFDGCYTYDSVGRKIGEGNLY